METFGITLTKCKDKESCTGSKGVACKNLELRNVCFTQVSGSKVLAVEKRNLNWSVPKPIADRFDEVVMSRYDQKKKWVGACAAILMYLSASEDEQRQFDQEALAAFGTGRAEEVLAKLMQPARSTPLKSPKSQPKK